MSTISVRLPDNISNALDHIAQETERSKSFHVQKALELYLKDQADLQIAFDRLSDTSDEIVSLKEMRQKLGL